MYVCVCYSLSILHRIGSRGNKHTRFYKRSQFNVPIQFIHGVMRREIYYTLKTLIKTTQVYTNSDFPFILLRCFISSS